MTRVLGMLSLLLALTLAASGCGGSKKSADTNGSGEVGPANISIWTPFVDPELKTFKAVVADFEKAHPGIHVKVVGGTNDDKIVAAICGGDAELRVSALAPHGTCAARGSTSART